MGADRLAVVNGTTEDKLEFFLESWREIFLESNKTPEEVIACYFCRDYQFYVNGHLLNFDLMVDRARRMRAEIDTASIRIVEAVGEGNKLAEIHEVDVVTKDGARSVVRLHNFLTFADNKIQTVLSLTMNMDGDERHADIASRH
ncbi:MAG: hypothetical protein AAF699_08590 [Pseudomonadota bacterium]